MAGGCCERRGYLNAADRRRLLVTLLVSQTNRAYSNEKWLIMRETPLGGGKKPSLWRERERGLGSAHEPQIRRREAAEVRQHERHGSGHRAQGVDDAVARPCSSASSRAQFLEHQRARRLARPANSGGTAGAGRCPSLALQGGLGDLRHRCRRPGHLRLPQTFRPGAPSWPPVAPPGGGALVGWRCEFSE